MNNTKRIKIGAFTLTLVPRGSFTGNVTPSELAIFRGEKGSRNHFHIRITNRYYKQTDIYVRRNPFGLDWNSEVIAEKWGKGGLTGFGEVYVYKGVLGYHISV